MIWFDGQNWQIRKFEVTETVKSHSDSKDGYAEGTTFQEVVLTEEQQARLEEIQGIEFNEMDAVLYVRDGIGGIPDNRSTEDKLIDKIIELDPEAIDDVADEIQEWRPGQEYARGVYVRFEGNVYRTIHAIRFHEEGTPAERPELYARLGKKDAETGLEEIVPDINNILCYETGFVGTYEGRVYKSNYGNNCTTPYPGTIFPDWWTDLGLIEEYLSQGGE